MNNKKKVKLSYQKIFNIISGTFIIACAFYYGTRFTKLYLDNKEIEKAETNSLIKVIRESNNNNENFKMINGLNYFTNNQENNYIMYSNLLWRIIRLNPDNSITAISDNSLSSLAFGNDLSSDKSNINKWLNDKDKGILINNLNKVEDYLQKNESCLDVFENPNNNPCKNLNSNNYFSLLSIPDYLNIGGETSYLKNDEFYYLNNTDNKKNVWMINDSGKITLSNGEDIIGVRPVITIKANIDYIKGNGTKDNPYIIEKENGYFGSYVKLGNDLWRIYEINDNYYKLILDNTIKINNKSTYNYSNNNSYYNDTIKNSLAYYLNNNYFNSLSYKNIINETDWSNGEYNSKNNYDYNSSLNKTIKSKIALPSIGNINLNNDIKDFYTMTQLNNYGNSIYIIENNKKVLYKNIRKDYNVIPTISISKDILKKGKGTMESPFEME